LTIGIVLIPVVTDYGDYKLASQSVQQTTCWFLGHIITAAAFISVLLFIALPAIPSGWGLYGEAAASYGFFLHLALPLIRAAELAE
jgi:hypothetical protein